MLSAPFFAHAPNSAVGTPLRIRWLKSAGAQSPGSGVGVASPAQSSSGCIRPRRNVGMLRCKDGGHRRCQSTIAVAFDSFSTSPGTDMACCRSVGPNALPRPTPNLTDLPPSRPGATLRDCGRRRGYCEIAGWSAMMEAWSSRVGTSSAHDGEAISW